jgi:hypothetical protein
MLERAETVGTAVGAPKQGPGSRGYLLAPAEKREQELGTTPHLSQHMLTGAGRREGVYQVTRMGRSEQSHARASSTEGGFARPVDANIAPHSHPPYSSPTTAHLVYGFQPG